MYCNVEVIMSYFCTLLVIKFNVIIIYIITI